MKEITIAEGVKIVFEEDCDSCKDLKERNEELYQETENNRREIEELYKLPIKKEERNTWDKGFNHCLSLICKHRNNI